jgi:hypothetical protein
LQIYDPMSQNGHEIKKKREVLSVLRTIFTEYLNI